MIVLRNLGTAVEELENFCVRWLMETKRKTNHCLIKRCNLHPNRMAVVETQTKRYALTQRDRVSSAFKMSKHLDAINYMSRKSSGRMG